MDRIRITMMQHEALFKEQVQALHDLYKIQKSAMQEINRQIRPHGSVLGSTKQAYDAAGTTNREDSLALTLSPFRVFKEMASVVPLNNVTLKNFDLEKLPEESMLESEINAGANSSELLDAYSKEPITDQISYAGSGQADVIHVDSRTTERVLEGKEHEIDENNSVVASNSNSSSKIVASDKSSEFFPVAVTNPDVHSDSSHTSKRCKENTMSSQGSSIMTPSEDQGSNIHQLEPKAPDNFSMICTKLNHDSHVDIELQEACETVAARILLSFAPNKSDKPDSGAANIIETERKLHQMKKHTDYTNNGIGVVTDSFNWAKKSIRRRSSRRAR